MASVAISLIATVCVFGALTLLPLWIGMVTDHPRLRRLALLPSIPYAAFAIVFNVNTIIVAVNGTSSLILTDVVGSTGFSALSFWIVTWVLFKRWRLEALRDSGETRLR